MMLEELLDGPRIVFVLGNCDGNVAVENRVGSVEGKCKTVIMRKVKEAEERYLFGF